MGAAEIQRIPDKVGSYEFTKSKRLRPGTAVYRSEPFSKPTSFAAHSGTVRVFSRISGKSRFKRELRGSEMNYYLLFMCGLTGGHYNILLLCQLF